MTSDSDKSAIVQIACGDQAEADKIAHHLIEHKLAACVQSHAIISVYSWEGTIERSTEVMLTAKTRSSLFPEIESAVLALHSYDVPEIVMFEISRGHGPYLDWLADQTK